MSDKIEIPEFLIEMSEQMRSQPNRCTSHPFWQVRCKRFVVTEEGYNDHHWVLIGEDGEFYRSDIDEPIDAAKFIEEHYPVWFYNWIKENPNENHNEVSDAEHFELLFDFGYDSLPEAVCRVFVQEIEEVVSTHLTEHDANWFIKRKQHDYPPLYTYVASAYWSPQIKKLQDWIISLTGGES